MTIRKLFELKNELVFEKTGIVLVPEDQIVDMDPVPLIGSSDADICPYCVLYIEEDFGRRSCEGCPMEAAGNRCGSVDGSRYISTYTRATMDLDSDTGISDLPGMKALIDLYNKENGFEGKEIE